MSEVTSGQRQTTVGFIEHIHQTVFLPSTVPGEVPRQESIRDAMKIRVDLCESMSDLDEILQSYTRASSGESPW